MRIFAVLSSQSPGARLSGFLSGPWNRNVTRCYMKTILFLFAGLLVLSVAVYCVIVFRGVSVGNAGAADSIRDMDKMRRRLSGLRLRRSQEDTITRVYWRLKEYFESESPYLNSGLTISDVARELYTNKVYVSKAIRINTGMNFCQFVNRYRVQYARRIMEIDPALRIAEVAALSGFNSTASMGISFRMFCQSTPGYCSKKIRLGTTRQRSVRKNRQAVS